MKKCGRRNGITIPFEDPTLPEDMGVSLESGLQIGIDQQAQDVDTEREELEIPVAPEEKKLRLKLRVMLCKLKLKCVNHLWTRSW